MTTSTSATEFSAQPVVYILEFSAPVGAPRTTDFHTGAPKEKLADPKRCSAQSYVGWTDDLPARFHKHVTGKGSSLCAYAASRGVVITIAAVFQVSSNEEAWTLEKAIKARKGTAALLRQLRAGKTPAGLPSPAYVKPLHTEESWLSL